MYKRQDLELIKLLGVIPSPYLQWYYHTNEKVAKFKAAPKTRGEYVQDLEKDVYAAYAEDVYKRQL